ncbi:MAG TPA: hypothetical protein VH165_07355 [Kofleriaceae bacterium]|nr:hypothetical protein [Kofleriaceae bacterium]
MSLAVGTLQGQSGKAQASTGTIIFPTAFTSPPVLVLTPMLRAGVTPEAVKVFILTLESGKATFLVEPRDKVDSIHWVASEATNL